MFPTTISVSLNNTFTAYENASLLGNLSASNVWASSSGTNYIGRRSTGTYFKGNIYSIRVYDRVLTQEEVMQNYNADKLRFGI